jgi:hypothetical protein
VSKLATLTARYVAMGFNRTEARNLARRDLQRIQRASKWAKEDAR